VSDDTQQPADEPRFPVIEELPLLGPPEAIPEGFAPVRFLPGQVNPPPKILWGVHFDPDTPQTCPMCLHRAKPKKTCSTCNGTGQHRDWRSLEWRLDRVKKVASAMNHAAAHAQDLLRQTIEIANHQEALLKQHVTRDVENTEVVQSMTDYMNADLQEKTNEILQLRAYVRAARADAVKYALIAGECCCGVSGDETMSWGGKTIGERLAEQRAEVA
jgi:hypothetical protein